MRVDQVRVEQSRLDKIIDNISNIRIHNGNNNKENNRENYDTNNINNNSDKDDENSNKIDCKTANCVGEGTIKKMSDD